MLAAVFSLTLVFVLGFALAVLFTFAALYWSPRHDSTPPEELPRGLLPRAVLWWADVLWPIHSAWAFTCNSCHQNFGSRDKLWQHQEEDFACGVLPTPGEKWGLAKGRVS